MGCLHSTRKFVVNDDISGQDTMAMEVFISIGLQPRDIDMLYTAFWDIDADSSGSIRPIELFAYFNIELGDFENHIFAVFDEDNSGVLNFMEFACSMWNLLTLNDSSLGVLGYLMKDPSGVMRIRYQDIKEIIEIIHKRKIESSAALATIYNNLRKNYPAELSMQEFCKWTAINVAVVSPLLILQLKLRKQIINEQYWVDMASERKMNPELGDFNFVKVLQANIKTKNDAFKRNRETADKLREIRERRGQGSGDDANVRNVARKESILLGIFNMKKPTAGGAGGGGSSSTVAPTMSIQTSTDDAVHSELQHSPIGTTKIKPLPHTNSSGSLKKQGSPSKSSGGRDGNGSSKSNKQGSSKSINNTSSNSLNKQSHRGSSSSSSASAAGGGPGRRRRSIMKPKLTQEDHKGGSGGGKKYKK